jgi:hypothetical protein
MSLRRVNGVFAGCTLFLASCAAAPEPFTLRIAKVRMGADPGVLTCNVPTTNWRRQGYPHIEATIHANCDSRGPIYIAILDPQESRTNGSSDAPLKVGESTTFFTPSFRKPKSSEVVVSVRVHCGGEDRHSIARCTIP